MTINYQIKSTYKKNLYFLYCTNAGFSHISHPPSKVMCLHFHTVILVIFLYFCFTRFNQFILIQIIPFCLYNNHKINLEKLQNVKMARKHIFLWKERENSGPKLLLSFAIWFIASPRRSKRETEAREEREIPEVSLHFAMNITMIVLFLLLL